ncbi:hypothetical protein QN239_15500 [Mycolicibacterium sp. Y3]
MDRIILTPLDFRLATHRCGIPPSPADRRVEPAVPLFDIAALSREQVLGVDVNAVEDVVIVVDHDAALGEKAVLMPSSPQLRNLTWIQQLHSVNRPGACLLCR